MVGTLLADYPFFADFFSARLKLRLDERHDLTVFLQVIPDRLQHFCQRNKGNINGRKINRFSQIFGHYITDIGLLHTHNPLILSEFPVQLSSSHIDRKSLSGAVLKHTIRKSAGG